MNIETNKIIIYLLHCSKYPERLNNIKKICNQYIICPSDTIKYTHQQNIAYDLIELIILAILNNDYPFLILEDDAALIDTLPNNINIPDGTDLIYWGCNRASCPPVISSSIYLQRYDNEYYRLYNSQSAHAILIPNKKSALFFKDILLQSLILNEFHDVLLPKISSSKIFLTPKDGPYFYQNDGRNHINTKFKWKNSKINYVKN